MRAVQLLQGRNAEASRVCGLGQASASDKQAKRYAKTANARHSATDRHFCGA
jgi:hypothetical protein